MGEKLSPLHAPWQWDRQLTSGVHHPGPAHIQARAGGHSPPAGTALLLTWDEATLPPSFSIPSETF